MSVRLLDEDTNGYQNEGQVHIDGIRYCLTSFKNIILIKFYLYIPVYIHIHTHIPTHIYIYT